MTELWFRLYEYLSSTNVRYDDIRSKINAFNKVCFKLDLTEQMEVKIE